MSFAQMETDRRLANVVQLGRVTAVESDSQRVRVQIGALDTALIPVAQLSSGAIRLHWMPSVGEQVVVFAPSGEMATAFVQGSVPQSGGAVASGADRPTIDLGAAKLVILGDLEITGNITVTGRIDVSEDVNAAGISLTGHTHGGVMGGGGSTGGPQ
jgi:phage baseplate assembly protein gpV